MLRGLVGPAPARPERCGLCGLRLAPGHRHLADTTGRALVCACTACALLFQRPDAAQGRYLPLPERFLTDTGADTDPDADTDRDTGADGHSGTGPGDGAIGEAQWAALRIPVSTAFVLRDSALGRPVLCYPSPAGATEADLDESAWRTVFGANRLAAALRPDVEALLLRRTPRRVHCYLVPVDLAYELVGRMRLRWHGFDGGAEARAELDAFFAALQERARPLTEAAVA
nr:DUF5947 family protein [Streptomyces sp. YSPA8]